MVSRTVVPLSFSLSMSTAPPWAETVASTIDSGDPLRAARPAPATRAETGELLRSKGTDNLDRVS